MEFFKIVKLARDKKGWSQEKLGARVGVSGGVISTYENIEKKAMPSLETLRRLASEFGLTASQLLGETDIPAHLLFNDEAAANAAGFKWDEAIKAPPKPYQPEDQEPGRFLMRVNLEDCELLTTFHQLNVRDRRDFIVYGNDLLRRDAAGKKSE